MKSYLSSVTKNKIVHNKIFRKFIKPVLTNKSCHLLENDVNLIHYNKIITGEHNLDETLNDH